MGRRKKIQEEPIEDQIVKRISEYISIGVPHCEPEHKRVEENASFERGEQWSEGDAQRQKARERPALPLNSMHKLLNAVANREIMERFKPKVFARGREDAGVAELMDVSSSWTRDMAETEHEETLAFRKMCSSGYGVMHKWWDPTQLDGDGMLVDEEVPLWNMLWDPSARRQNLVDRRWHLCGKYIDKEDAEAMFEAAGKSARKLKVKSGTSFDDDEHYGGYGDTSLPGGTWGQIKNNKWISRTGNEVFIIEAEWKERKAFYKVAYPVQFDQMVMVASGDPQAFVIDPMNQQQVGAQQYQQMDESTQYEFMMGILAETTMQKFEKPEEFKPFLDQYEGLTGQKFDDFARSYRDTVQYAILSDNTLIDFGERQDGFTYEFMTGFPYETSEMVQFYGMVDVAKAPQDFKNVFYSNLLTLYMTSPKQHLLIEEGALKDTQAFLNEYSKVTGASIVPDGFITGGRFQLLEPPRFPPMLESLINIVDGSVQDIFGLSSIESNTQGDLRRISGNVVQSAKAATNTLLAILFDGLRRYRKRWGLLTAKCIMTYYDPQELHNIVGDDYEFIGQMQGRTSYLDTWPADIRFNIKIDEAPTSISEQMETVDFLTRTGTIEKWVAAGHLPFDEALDLLVTIPKGTRERIKRARNEQQKIQEQMAALQRQIQDQMALQESFVKFIQTREGGQQILADFSLLNTMATQQAQEIVSRQQQQAQEAQQTQQPQ